MEGVGGDILCFLKSFIMWWESSWIVEHSEWNENLVVNYKKLRRFWESLVVESEIWSFWKYGFFSIFVYREHIRLRFFHFIFSLVHCEKRDVEKASLKRQKFERKFLAANRLKWRASRRFEKGEKFFPKNLDSSNRDREYVKRRQHLSRW